MNNYILYQSQFIVDNQADIIQDLQIAHAHFEKLFPDRESTWSYNLYNIFSLTAPSTNFYQIYKELRTLVRSELGNTRPLWFQAWLNYHKPNEVLDWHDHTFEYHGYISIDPKKTNTVFENYSIENKVGQIYFAPGYRRHKVEVLEPFEGERITIGFDIQTIPDQPYVKYTERPWKNLSLIPLL
jgi:hypothetical protein